MLDYSTKNKPICQTILRTFLNFRQIFFNKILNVVFVCISTYILVYNSRYIVARYNRVAKTFLRGVSFYATGIDKSYPVYFGYFGAVGMSVQNDVCAEFLCARQKSGV